MTRYQEKRINQIEEIMLNLVGYPETKEIKEKSVHDIGHGIVSLVIEVGDVGDEGTLAAVFCRQRAHIFIGPKGGCSTYTTSRKDGSLITYEDTPSGVCWRCVLDSRC